MGASGSIPNGPAAPLGISRLSAPVQAADIQPNPAAAGMQASASRTQDTSAAYTDLSSRRTATAQLKTAPSNVAKAAALHDAAGGTQQGRSQSEGLPGAAGSQQHPAETAAEGANSLQYKLSTVDRPLSSFAQRGGSTGMATRPAGAGSRAAGGEFGGNCFPRQDVEAGAGASVALDYAPAAGKQVADGNLASTAALAGTDILPEQRQEGDSAEPFHTAGQHHQGYSAAAPHTVGQLRQQESFLPGALHEASLLQSPGSKPDQAGISPQESVLHLEGSDGTQQHPLSSTAHPAQWRTDHGPESIQYQAATPAGAAGHAVNVNKQQPTLGYDAGHVAARPDADMGNLLPASTGTTTPGHTAAAASSSQSRGSATAARVPSIIAEGNMDAASPSGFSRSFVGQSLDLSKVSCLFVPNTLLLCFDVLRTNRGPTDRVQPIKVTLNEQLYWCSKACCL